jgi:hypothetical protein
MIGAPDMLPLSLRNAITEPVKVSAPMAEPSDSSMIGERAAAPMP